MKSDKRGFTLIELIIVMVITGVLAGIAVVSMQGMTHRAIVAEGVAGLGRVRQAIREYYNVHGAYPNYGAGVYVTTLGLDINPGELNGTYFSEGCYYIPATGNLIRCYVYGSGVNVAPKVEITKSITTDLANGHIVMYIADGTVATASIPNSGYPQV